jgi:hypothetical protein
MRITERDETFRIDVLADNGIRFRAVLAPAKRDHKGEHTGLIEFFDMRHPHTPDGQFTGMACTVQGEMGLLDRVPWSRPMLLSSTSENWRIDGQSMFVVREWANKIMSKHV